MPVMTNDAGRADIGFARGTRFAWTATWERSSDGGRTFTPVDLTAWDCRLLLYDMADRLVLEKTVRGTADGRVDAVIEAADTTDVEWSGRRQGTWRITAAQSTGEALSAIWAGEPDGSVSELTVIPDLESGDVELVAWGYWRCD